jgi:tRNA (uracil-5-)-methyltransferase
VLQELIDTAVASSGASRRFVAVVDPSRTGLEPEVCRALRRCPQVRRVIYVSCNPQSKFTRWDFIVKEGSLLDNAALLCGPPSAAEGEPFSPVFACPVDMFPNTPHCELVIAFER